MVELDKFVPSHGNAHLFPSPGDDLYTHRLLVQVVVYGRDRHCWVDGCNGDGVWWLHEGIYRRSDVQGWAKDLRVLIHTPYNCVGLCGLHHETADEPSRFDVADWMLLRYGRNFVRWCRYLPFKINPLRGWLSQFSY